MSEGELPPLDPELRALIDAAHDVHDPAPVQRTHTFARLEAKIAAGAVGGTASALAWASSAKAAVVVCGVVAIAVAALLHARVETPSPRGPAPRAATRQEQSAAAPSALPTTVEDDDAQDATQRERTESVEPLRQKEHALPSLDGETDLLRAANAALNRADGARALKLLAQYDRRFPTGALREEYSAAEVLALCASGRAREALARARTFATRYPRSPLLARVMGTCAVEAAPKGAP
jgi:hypothetical protein